MTPARINRPCCASCQEFAWAVHSRSIERTEIWYGDEFFFFICRILVARVSLAWYSVMRFNFNRSTEASSNRVVINSTWLTELLYSTSEILLRGSLETGILKFYFVIHLKPKFWNFILWLTWNWNSEILFCSLIEILGFHFVIHLKLEFRNSILWLTWNWNSEILFCDSLETGILKFYFVTHLKPKLWDSTFWLIWN